MLRMSLVYNDIKKYVFVFVCCPLDCVTGVRTARQRADDERTISICTNSVSISVIVFIVETVLRN